MSIRYRAGLLLLVVHAIPADKIRGNYSELRWPIVLLKSVQGGR